MDNYIMTGASSTYALPGIIPISKFNEIRLSIDEVRIVIEKSLGVTLNSLLVKTRNREVVALRQRFAYIFNWYGFSLKKIGRLLNQDHVTILWSRKVILNEMTYDRKLSAWVENIQRELWNYEYKQLN